MKAHTNFRHCQYDNHFGLRDEAIIREAETIFTTLAAMKGMPDGDFGIEHFKAIHKHVLGDMYGWAGTFRTAEMAVGGNYGKAAPVGVIELETKRVLSALKKENPREMSVVEFADKMALYYKRLYEISPFPDGNARAARFLLDKFADVNDMQIKWEDVPAEAFHAAMQNSMKGDHGALKQLFRVMTDFKDLADLYSTNAISDKIQQIATQVGLTADRMPSMALLGSSQSDIIKLAHYSQQVVTKDLEQLAKGGPTMRDWNRTSIQNEVNNTVGSTESNQAALNRVLSEIKTDSQGRPRLRGPGM